MSSDILEILALFKKIEIQDGSIDNCQGLIKVLKDLSKKNFLSSENEIIFLDCIGNFMSKTVDLVSYKLLNTSDLKETAYKHDKVHLLITQFSSTVVTAINLLTPLNNDSLNHFFFACIPFITKLYLIFYKDSLWSCQIEKNNVENIMNATLKIVQQSSFKNLLDSLCSSSYTKTLKLFTSCLTK